MYALDTQEARRADQTGNRITEIGKYVGSFVQAEDVTARTGTKGVGLRFESGGQIANLSLYTLKADGTKLVGNQVLMAIMTCLKLRSIAPEPGVVTRWDNDARKEFSEKASTFPTLLNAQVGLLLETEGYWRDDGTEAKPT